MDNVPAPQARGTQDITVVWIVFALAVIGLIAAYWLLLYKPKVEEIQAVQASINSKEQTLETYKREAGELLNYEDQFAALVHQWNGNQHYFVNGLTWDAGSHTYKPPFEGREQWAIFETLLDVWNTARAAGVYLQDMWVSEELEFYMDDEPFEVPIELVNSINWTTVLSNRGENTNPLFSSHNLAVKFYGNLEEIKRFIEYIQKMEGEDKKLFSIHCFETAQDMPSYRRDVVGLSDVVLADITLEIDMMMTCYELNPDATTANTPPDIPGQASCSYGTSGGGGGGRSGGGGGRGGGGVGLGI